MTETTTREELLRHAGEALYGPFWRTELALALGIGERSLRRMMLGEREIKDGILMDLAALCEEEGRRLLEISRLLRAHTGETTTQEARHDAEPQEKIPTIRGG